MKIAIKIVALIKVLTSCYSSLLGQESAIDIGFPVLRHVPVFPPLVRHNQNDSTLSELLEKVYQEWRQKQANTEQAQESQEENAEQKESQKSLERSLKRRRIEKEEDTDDFLQLVQTQPSLTTPTTTTSSVGMANRPLGRSSARIWEEAEWAGILQGIDQEIARENPEREKARATQEWFSGFLTHIEDTLVRREPNLVNMIAQRFFDREITLGELSSSNSRSHSTIRLRVRAGHGQLITSEQIQLIGERFPNLRELNLSGFELGDRELAVLAEQPFASRLTALNITHSRITLQGIEQSMKVFASLTRLGFTDSFIRNQGLAALARQPFACNLTYLDIENNKIDEGGIASMDAFVSLTHLNVSRNELGDSGLERLAQQPFAPHLTTLEFSHCENSNTGESITEQGLVNSMRVFANLRILDISRNGIDDEGFAVIARQPFAPHLTELDVNDNGLTTEGIVATIGNFTGVTHLNISLNRIGDAGLAFLAQQPFARNVTYLDIEWNGITLEGIRTSMRSFTSLRTLDISGNNIGDAGLEQLAQQPFASQLISLDILNNGLTAGGIRASLGIFANLQYLYMSYSSLSGEGFQVLAELPFAPRLALIVHEKSQDRAPQEQYKKYASKFKLLNLRRDWSTY